VALDAAGNLYIADRDNNRVRRISAATGIITTVAGTGALGYGGDGGPATSAILNRPIAVALDGAGNLYIADWFNNRVRKVDTTGVITTVAGTGTAGFAGDGGAATSALLRDPTGVAVDAAGNLYIADRVNARVRRVDTAGNITTFAGERHTGLRGRWTLATNASMVRPISVAVDAAGQLFITDTDGHNVRKVDAAGFISTVAGTGVGGFSGDGGPATAAQLLYPWGVAIDGCGERLHRRHLQPTASA
jgi:sugar lactone lactonase YvrE